MERRGLAAFGTVHVGFSFIGELERDLVGNGSTLVGDTIVVPSAESI
jgi:hypothetical protein